MGEKDMLKRLRGAAEGAEPIDWVGPEREIEYLRGAIASETDPVIRERMQRRLATVEALGGAVDPTRDP